jgi:hypothetical protein
MLSGGENHIGEKTLVPLDEAAFEERFLKTHRDPSLKRGGSVAGEKSCLQPNPSLENCRFRR